MERNYFVIGALSLLSILVVVSAVVVSSASRFNSQKTEAAAGSDCAVIGTVSMSPALVKKGDKFTCYVSVLRNLGDSKNITCGWVNKDHPRWPSKGEIYELTPTPIARCDGNKCHFELRMDTASNNDKYELVGYDFRPQCGPTKKNSALRIPLKVNNGPPASTVTKISRFNTACNDGPHKGTRFVEETCVNGSCVSKCKSNRNLFLDMTSQYTGNCENAHATCFGIQDSDFYSFIRVNAKLSNAANLTKSAKIKQLGIKVVDQGEDRVLMNNFNGSGEEIPLKVITTTRRKISFFGATKVECTVGGKVKEFTYVDESAQKSFYTLPNINEESLRTPKTIDLNIDVSNIRCQ